MKHSHRRTTQYLLFLAAVLLLTAAFALPGAWLKRNIGRVRRAAESVLAAADPVGEDDESTGAEGSDEKSPSEIFTAALYDGDNPLSYAADTSRIYWWKSDFSDEYYFFLPSGIHDKELRWEFNTAENVTVDGQNVHDSDYFQLADGVHTLRVTPEGGKEEVYRVNVMRSRSIPSLFLTTRSGENDYIQADKNNSESGEIVLKSENGSILYAGEVSDLKCRGNSTFNDSMKKPYRIKLADEADLLGMGAAKKWILIANDFDPSLERNMLANDLADLLKIPFQTQAHYVDLYLNGEYQGNYLLSEKVEVGADRVDIRDLDKETEEMNGYSGLSKEMKKASTVKETHDYGAYQTESTALREEPSDLTGGYLLEYEVDYRLDDEYSYFHTSMNHNLVLKSPEYATEDEARYIGDLFERFEEALYSDSGYNGQGEYYQDFIDTDAFCRKYILEELSKNMDSSYTSQYIIKEPDDVKKEFIPGPGWDYDMSFGNVVLSGDDVYYLRQPQALYAALEKDDRGLWYGLYLHEDFRDMAKDEYRTFLSEGAEEKAMDYLQQQTQTIIRSALMNNIRWNKYPDLQTDGERNAAFLQEVKQLAEFYSTRLEWMALSFGISQ
jgi:hypothetical protein